MPINFGATDPRRARRIVFRTGDPVPPTLPALLPRERPLPVGRKVYAEIELSDELKQQVVPVKYEGDSPMAGRLFTVPGWSKWNMKQRLAFMRAFVEDKARDPMIAEKSEEIIRAAGVREGDYKGEWAALLKWVQRNVRFKAEPEEQLQSPQYTLTQMYADCDDKALLLAALGHARRLPYRFTLSGRDDGNRRVRWVEGHGDPPTASWSHIYLHSRWPPFRPTHGAFAEPTLDVPLGWDSLKDPPPKSRVDMGADEPEPAAEAPSVVSKQLAILKKTQQVAAKLPWYTIAGSVVGTVLSYVIVQGVVAPGLKKQ